MKAPPGDGAGQRFGPYELRWEIGSGGMATVHAASLPGPGGFEKLVCIKQIRPEMVENASWIESFVTEAKLVSQIQHPNVVQVSDLGCVDGTYYIAMEFVAGIDALTLLRAAGEKGVLLPVPAAVHIVRELCEGLDAAHRQCDLSGRPLGIVHRDVSPQNVLLSYEGQVKITDFGVAKSTIAPMTTMPGEIKGKASYMSPEQARGERVDARTDIFAAGIMLHELLSGEPFYPPSDPVRAIMRARTPKVAPLDRFRDDVPPGLANTVYRALAVDPVDRFPTAWEMGVSLNEALALELGTSYGTPDLANLIEWVLEAPAEEATAPMESAPTRVASTDEIRQRRAKRAAGLPVRPAPPGTRKADPNRPGFGRRIADLARRFLPGEHAHDPNRRR